MIEGEHLFLQFGHYANYVGGHFWNSQLANGNNGENSAFYHVDVSAGKSYPRLLLFDLKGSFGALSQEGWINVNAPSLEEDAQDMWDGETLRVEADAHVSSILRQKPERLVDPKTDVQVWSDFCKTRFHPRSLHELNQHQYQNDLTPFDTYTIGKSIGQDLGFVDAVIDGDFRFFVEACDSLQVIHVLSDIYNGFGGLAASFLEQVKDDFPKLPLVNFTFRGEYKPDRSLREIRKEAVNAAWSLDRLNELSSIVIPFDAKSLLPKYQKSSGWSRYLLSDFDLPYISSAIAALAVDTIIRPTTSSYPVGYLPNMLNSTDRTRIANLELILPLFIPDHIKPDDSTLVNKWASTESEEASLHSLSGVDLQPAKHTTAQVLNIRGINGQSTLTNWKQYRLNKQCLDEAFTKSFKCFQTHSFFEEAPFVYKYPFPSVFSSEVGSDGSLKQTGDPTLAHHFVDLRLLTRLSNSSAVGDFIEQDYCKALTQVHSGQLWEFSEGGEAMDRDELRDLKSNLHDLACCYSDFD